MHRLVYPFLSSKLPLFLQQACRCLLLPTFGHSASSTVPFSRPGHPQGPSTHRASNTASGQIWVNRGGAAWGEGRLLRLWLNWNLPLVELVPGTECSKENRAQAMRSTRQHIRQQPAPMGSSAQQKDQNQLCWVSGECWWENVPRRDPIQPGLAGPS